VPGNFQNDDTFCRSLLTIIDDQLGKHNFQENEIRHQAMVLVDRRIVATNLSNSLCRLSGAQSEANTFAKAVIGDTNGETFTTEFVEGKFKVAIVCGKLMEGFDNSNVSLCIILCKVKSLLTFNQFIGRCQRMSELTEGRVDTVNGKIISFPQFGQRDMWKRNHDEYIQVVDPEDDFDSFLEDTDDGIFGTLLQFEQDWMDG